MLHQKRKKNAILVFFSRHKKRPLESLSALSNGLVILLINLRLPQMPRHIHMPIRLEQDFLFFKQRALTTPPRCCASFLIHHPMTRKGFCTRRVSQCAAYHPRMARPACQGGNMAVRGHTTIRNLSDDVQHILPKLPHLFRRHPIGIVLHNYMLLFIPLRIYNFSARNPLI